MTKKSSAVVRSNKQPAYHWKFPNSTHQIFGFWRVTSNPSAEFKDVSTTSHWAGSTGSRCPENIRCVWDTPRCEQGLFGWTHVNSEFPETRTAPQSWQLEPFSFQEHFCRTWIETNIFSFQFNLGFSIDFIFIEHCQPDSAFTKLIKKDHSEYPNYLLAEPLSGASAGDPQILRWDVGIWKNI